MATTWHRSILIRSCLEPGTPEPSPTIPAMPTQTIQPPSDACYELITKWEGLHRKLADGRIEAYADPIGIWTIGFGSTYDHDRRRPVQAGDLISQADAERWLKLEVKEKADAIADLCEVPLTQSMFDALVSFAYNVGIGAFEESTLRRKLNQKDYQGASKEFDRWVKAGSGVLQGLVNRRNDEEALFCQDGLLATVPVAAQVPATPPPPAQAAPPAQASAPTPTPAPGPATPPPQSPASADSQRVTALVDSFLKKQVMGSQDLTSAEKTFVPAGTVIPITACSPDRSQHFKLQLRSPATAQDGVTTLKQVYIYEPHFKIEGLKKDALIKLAVKYRRQTDNDAYSIFGPGWRQCNLTSNTMMADFLLDGELTRQAAAKGQIGRAHV